jgi:hypothetical protein
MKWREYMKPGDLVKYGFALGILVRKLQWDEFEQEDYLNWDGEPAWWVQWMEDNSRRWNYEEELTLVSKGS